MRDDLRHGSPLDRAVENERFNMQVLLDMLGASSDDASDDSSASSDCSTLCVLHDSESDSNDSSMDLD